MGRRDAGGPRVLVAGMGNVLHGDDGFGVRVADALATRDLPPEVRVVEVGIGGIHLVQELMAGYDALIIIDAVDRGAAPGTLFVLEPEVDVPRTAPEEHFAETHYTVPMRVLSLAGALGVLPERVLIVGGQTGAVDEPTLEMTAPVRASVGRAVSLVRSIVERLCREEQRTATASPGESDGRRRA